MQDCIVVVGSGLIMGGFFGRLFGGGGRDQTEQRPSRISDQDRAILVRIHHTLR